MPLVYSSTKENIFFQEGLRAVSKNGKWGFIDKSGAEVIPLVYDEVKGFENGEAKVRKGEKWSIVKSPLLKKTNITWHNNYESEFLDSTYQLVLKIEAKKRINEKALLQSLQIEINGEEPPIKDLNLEYKKEVALYVLQATIGVPTTWGIII